MTQTASDKPAWATGSLFEGFEGIAEDFLALLNTHDPQTDRLKAAYLIRHSIGVDGISMSVFDAWANQDSANQIPVESLQAEWDAAEKILRQLHKGDPERKLYNMYLERIDELRYEVLPSDWMGVFEHRSK